jgi:hypothetical protein
LPPPWSPNAVGALCSWSLHSEMIPVSMLINLVSCQAIPWGKMSREELLISVA